MDGDAQAVSVGNVLRDVGEGRLWLIAVKVEGQEEVAVVGDNRHRGMPREHRDQSDSGSPEHGGQAVWLGVTIQEVPQRVA